MVAIGPTGPNGGFIDRSTATGHVDDPEMAKKTKLAMAQFTLGRVASLSHAWRMFFMKRPHPAWGRHSKGDRLHRLQPMEIASILMFVFRKSIHATEIQDTIDSSKICPIGRQAQSGAQMEAHALAHFCVM